MSAAAVRELLARHGLRPRRDLGQNFLCDENLAVRLVERAGVEPGDTVVEIGAGFGCLTRALAAVAERVIALEIDAGLVRALHAEALLPSNAELVHADALRADLAALLPPPPTRVRLIANLPYAVSAPLLRRFLDLRERLADWSVMLQREVAVRLLAPPGNREYGSLAVLHRLTVVLEREMDLAPGCFHPAPRVRSSFVRVRPLDRAPVDAEELPALERFLRAAFGTRRKTLVNALRAGALPGLPANDAVLRVLADCGVDARARAEALAPATLLAVSRALREAGGGAP